MSEFKFAVGDVVRHRVGGDWRGVVIETGGDSRGVEYRVRFRDPGDGGFSFQWLFEFELIADSEPPSGSPVGAVVRPGGDGAREAVPWRNRLTTVG